MSYFDSCREIVKSIEITDIQKEAIYQLENLRHVGSYIISVAEETFEFMNGYEIIIDYIQKHIDEISEKYILKYRDMTLPEETVVKEMLSNYIKEHFKYYKVPVTWEMYGTITTLASSPEDAVKYVENNLDEFDLPEKENYVTDSFRLSADSFEENVSLTEEVKN